MGGTDYDVRKLPLGHVQPDPHNIRTNSDKVKIDQLRESLAAALERGEEYLHPITVYPVGRERFRIKFGHRRYYAALDLAKQRPVSGLHFRVVPKPETEAVLLREQLEEALHQEGLSPMDRAMAIKRYKDLTGKSVRQLAESLAEIGLDRDQHGEKRGSSWVGFHLALTRLHPQLQQFIADGQLAASTAYRLRSLPPGEQVRLARKIVGEGLSRRDLEELTGPDSENVTTLSEPPTATSRFAGATGALPGGEALGERTSSGKRGRSYDVDRSHSAVTTSMTIPVPREDISALPVPVQIRVREAQSDRWGEKASEEQKAVARDAIYWGGRSVAEAEALADAVWAEWPTANEIAQGALVFLRRLLTQPRPAVRLESGLASLMQIYGQELARRLSADSFSA